MRKTSMRLLIVVAITLSFQTSSWAQSARALLESALQAHGRTRVADIAATGSVTKNGATEVLKVYSKGNGVGRLENGSGNNRNVLVFNQGKSWAGNDTLRPLKEHTAQRRLTLFPFLDLISDLDSPHIQITDRGVVPVNGRTAYKISIRTVDPNANQRFLRRPLEEAADFFIDTQSRLIVRSERLRPTEENMDFLIPSVLEFSDYRNVNGVMAPFRIVNTVGRPDIGVYQSTTVFDSVTINSGIPDSFFAPAETRSAR